MLLPPSRNVFRVVQKLTNVSLIDESPRGPTLAGYINNTLHELGVSSRKSLHLCRTVVRLTTVVLNILKMFSNSVHLPCDAHSLNLVGQKLSKEAEMFSCYMKSVNSIISLSSHARMIFLEITGESAEKHTIRWFSEFIQAVQHLRCFNKLSMLWKECVTRKVAKQTAKLVIQLLEEPQRQYRLALQLAVYVDFGMPLLNASNFLEGDGFLAPFVFDRITSLTASVQNFSERKL